MSTKRRSAPIVSAQGALTPAACDSQSPFEYEREIQLLKKLLASERKRHAVVEGLLTRMNTQLEQQIADLRGLYMRTITIPVGEKR